MRFTLMIVMLAGPAYAADPCDRGMGPIGSPQPIELVSWAATQQDGRTENGMTFGPSVALTLTYRNTLPEGIRMIEASARFQDALGGIIGGVYLPKDAEVAAGDMATVTLTLDPGMSPVARIASLAQEDVRAAICTTGIVQADGTVQTFK